MNDEKQTEILKEQINKFIIDIACVKNINDESDIFLDLGIDDNEVFLLIIDLEFISLFYILQIKIRFVSNFIKSIIIWIFIIIFNM